MEKSRIVATLVGVSVAIYNGHSQRQRWEKEDHLHDPRPQPAWSNELVKGKYRTLNLATLNALSNPVLLVSIEIVSPDGAIVAPYSDYASRTFETPSKIRPVDRRIIANSFDKEFYLALSTPNAPNDQGEFIEFQVNYEEITSPRRPFSQTVRTYGGR
jgi:hypothetical protein